MFNLFKKKKSSNQHKGIIGKYFENEFPVIVRFVNKMPINEVISRLPWLTIISWKYDGSQRNGMPPDCINQKMIKLEEAIEKAFKKSTIAHHAYNRTGNNLKEFNYYISDRQSFMTKLNSALSKHEHYPIEITFYEDPEWIEMSKLISDFDSKHKQ
ncbi:MAG: DUF695 domain-containing protein [bacterium]